MIVHTWACLGFRKSNNLQGAIRKGPKEVNKRVEKNKLFVRVLCLPSVRPSQSDVERDGLHWALACDKTEDMADSAHVHHLDSS